MTNTLQVSTRGERDIVMTRAFDAPADLVWEAFTHSPLIRRWMNGPPGWKMTGCEDDARVGGHYRHEWTGPAGEQMAMVGEYQEVNRPLRLKRTEVFEFGGASQEGQQIASVDFLADGASTRVTITVAYPSQAARDEMIASGMEQGAAYSYDQLEQLLATLPAGGFEKL